MKRILVAICLSFISINLSASVGSQLNSWFDNSNVTNPGVYQGQSARQLSLGGFSARAPVDQAFHFVDVNTPHLSAGCGGIDFYAGGISGLDADAFIESLRKIGQNAKGLVFMLGLRIVSPTLENAIAEMKGFADKINKFSQDSCEAATRLVGGALKKMGKEDSTCIVRKMDKGGLTWDEAKKECPSADVPKPSDPKIAFTEGNLVWDTLMANDYFKNEKEMAEIVMNITGTVVITRKEKNNKDSPLTFIYLPPALSSGGGNQQFQNIKNAILTGKSAPDGLMLRRCEDKDKIICIPISDLKKVTPDWDGLYTKIDGQLHGIALKIKADTALTDAEKGLIAFSRLPIYRYMASATASNTLVDTKAMISQYSQLIAEEILYRYLDGLMMTTQIGVKNLPGGASGDPEVVKFSAGLDKSIEGLAELNRDVNKRAEDMDKMLMSIRNYESALLARISPPLQTAAKFGQ